MSSSKGKGRAEPLKDDSKSDSSVKESSSPSLLSRVAASATGLTRNAFTTPNPNELSQQAAAALSNSNKPQAIPNTGTSTNYTLAESSRTSQTQPNSQASSSSIRTGHSEQHAQISESEFSNFLDGIDSFVPSESFGNIPIAGTNGRFDEAWELSRNTRQPLQEPTNITVPQQEQQDGSDVLAILSDPSALDSQMEEPPPLDEDDENYDWGLTPAQITKLRELTKDILPVPPQHANSSVETPLNLIPDFQGQEGAREQYVEDWEGVLNRYADEVWGGLAPLVREARKEVEEAKENLGSEREGREMKAVRRLGAILGHLEQRRTANGLNLAG